MIEIYRNDLIYGISSALDYVEREVVEVAKHHSKRVAYLSAEMGRSLGYDNDELLALAACAALHDNALTEYKKFVEDNGGKMTSEGFGNQLAIHCEMGERNISALSFYDSVRGAVLYHHEEADGSGPFGKIDSETPMFAQLIHIADSVDAAFDLSVMSPEKFISVSEFVKAHTGTRYSQKVARAFLSCFSSPAKMRLDLATLDENLKSSLPEIKTQYSAEQLMKVTEIFSRIIDYKSAFTSSHSSGIAEKAYAMGEFYGWDKDTCARLYIAGALHDVGKLMVDTDVLEKTDRLTEDEYIYIKNHAMGTYAVLHGIKGMEEISRWAYLHHEKLDGSGYPFGLKGGELNDKERLMACLDIYQALREERPYKDGMTHADTMRIMNDMAAQNKIDGRIVGDIDRRFGK